mgnify:CR=1 FL=1
MSNSPSASASQMTPEEAVRRVAQARELLSREVHKVIIGQDQMLEEMLICIFARGHCLTIGVPGLAKTLTISTLAKALAMKFSRIQFTPDLMPSDITGTEIIDQDQATGQRHFRFVQGPIFSNIVLADEINRTPPKTQAALLEAMGEGQVTVDGTPRRLADPFLVVATQNPIEYEGTYPLPEAQLDRFLVKVDVGYPDEETEAAMLGLARRGLAPAALDAVAPIVEADAAGETIAAVAELVGRMRDELDATTVTDDVARYLLAVVRRTRELPSVEVGASPRAAVHLLAASRGTARLAGRAYVTPDDVVAAAAPVLRHRLVLRAEAELDRFRPDDAVAAAVASVPVPR